MLPSAPSALDVWLDRHKRWIVLVWVAAAVLLRGSAAIELGQGPCLELHRWPQSDMYFFDQWARLITHGDWLTDRALHPLHNWHRDVAQGWFAAHPEEVARVLAADPGGAGGDPAQALWNEWYGQKTFHQEPLYAYLIAGVYLLAGEDVRHVLYLQLGLGVLNVVLVSLLAWRVFGAAVGAVTGVLALLWGPMLYYELILLRPTLILTFSLLILWVLDGALRALDRPGRWVGVGLVVGGAMTLMSTFLLVLAGLVVALGVLGRGAPRRALSAAGALLLGVAITHAPVVARNVAVGAPPLSTSSVGPVTFISSNAVGFKPELGFFVSDRTAAILDEAQGRLLPTARLTLATHPSPLSWLQQLGEKFARVWHWYELPNNTNYYLFRQYSVTLDRLATFSLVGPLILVGAGLALRSGPAAWPILAMGLFHLGLMVAFYVLSRFRAPMVGVWLPLAGLAVVQLARWAGARSWGRLGACTGGLLGAALWISRPLPDGLVLIDPRYVLSTHVAWYQPALQEAIRQQRWEEVVRVCSDALDHAPMGVREPDVSAEPLAPSLARLYANVYQNMAAALVRLGRSEEAAAARQRALTLARAIPTP